jgi:pyruvate formate lyase activating enzyme
MDVVERDRVYYDLSGGGMTLSGGEPTMQKAFCAGLLKAAKHKDIPTAVETCGCSIPQDFKEAVADADMLYFDFKLENSGLHKKYTGASNARIKENLRWLISSNVRFTLRMPVLPCINTSEERLAEYICFLKTTGFDTPIELMPYHRLGVYKYSALGRDYMLEDMKRPSLEELKAIRDLLEKHGFESRVVV